jgi:hypothetical protein
VSITAFSFGEWLPDLPDLGNPGLTVATNVIPVTGGYQPFLPLSPTAGGTLPAQPIGAIYPISVSPGSATTITAITQTYAGSFLNFYSTLITTGSAHGLSVGDTVVIIGVVATGTYQISGAWQVDSVPSSTTFYIPDITGINSGAYSSGGSVRKGYTSALIAGTATDLYAYENTAWTKRSASTYIATSAWEFASYQSSLIATNNQNVPQVQTSGGINFTTLATSGSAPVSATVGIVNQFAVLGSTSDAEYALQWSAIDNVRNWPTPNSSTAIATQSGRQYLSRDLGDVRAIHGGDQIGIVLQRSGVTRMTYAGPPTVFQFDTISKTHGAAYKHGSIQINSLVFFVSSQGFHVTDGVNVQPIGNGKIDRYFLTSVASGSDDLVRAAHHKPSRLIYWIWPSSAAVNGQPDQILAYNYEEKRWTLCGQIADLIFTPAATETTLVPWGFDASHCLATFTGSPGTAIMVSSEVEPQPGGCALINGIKPIIASSGTAPVIGVQVGSRDDQSTAVSYSSTTTPTSRTGFADFRSDARYHRARVYIAGNFDKALGLEIDATPTGGM